MSYCYGEGYRMPILLSFVPPPVGYPQEGGAYAHGQQQQPPHAYPPQAKAESYPTPGK